MARRKQGFESSEYVNTETQLPQESEVTSVEKNDSDANPAAESPEEPVSEVFISDTTEPEPLAPPYPVGEEVKVKAKKVKPILPVRKGGFAEGRKPRNIPKFS